MAGILKVDTIQNANADNIITQTNSTTLTIGASGDTVTLAAGATSSGFGRSGTVNWDTTKKTTGFTAVSGVGYFCDTTSGAFTVTLPLTPTAGDIVSIADYDGTAGTNAITVGRNSSNINGDAADLIITKNYAAISFVYVDATAGWRSVDTSNVSDVINPFVAATGGTITTCGDYKIHTFTGPGTFTVTNAGSGSGGNSVEYLVVAGGASGGKGDAGGGGGAGGYRQNYPSPATAGLPVTATAYPITVGGGGAAITTPNTNGAAGSNSVFSTITSAGGGGGGGPNTGGGPTTGAPGSPGGSGGGGAHGANGGTGGTGNSPPTSPPQGNPGGIAATSGPIYGGAGGGGATAAGTNGSPSVVAPGGNGTANLISGSSVTYAGGGGGARDDAGIGGSGGSGGGGTGGSSNNSGTNGTANTGGGGGATADQPATSGAGGSGIVIIRYQFQ